MEDTVHRPHVGRLFHCKRCGTDAEWFQRRANIAPLCQHIELYGQSGDGHLNQHAALFLCSNWWLDAPMCHASYAQCMRNIYGAPTSLEARHARIKPQTTTRARAHTHTHTHTHAHTHTHTHTHTHSHAHFPCWACNGNTRATSVLKV